MGSKNGVMPMDSNRTVSFSLGEMAFEYDEEKNRINIKKHGISFRSAARIFFDYDRIEFFDDNHTAVRCAMIQSAIPQPDESHKLEKYQSEM